MAEMENRQRGELEQVEENYAAQMEQLQKDREF